MVIKRGMVKEYSLISLPPKLALTAQERLQENIKRALVNACSSSRTFTMAKLVNMGWLMFIRVPRKRKEPTARGK